MNNLEEDPYSANCNLRRLLFTIDVKRMEERKRYRKKDECFVTAVQLNLDTEGFVYQKWGAEQTCKAGDWLVDNEGEIYTIDQGVFSRTYRKVKLGIYVKTSAVWAEIASESGCIVTKEGSSNYKKGDYLVYNNKDGSDGYCMSATKFNSMYVPESDEK